MYLHTTLLSIAILAPTWHSAYLAYMDPTTGGMLLQILFGGVAGVAVIIRLSWHRLKTRFSRRRQPSPLEKEKDKGEEG